MQIKDHLSAVAQEETLAHTLQALLFQVVQLLEEGRHMYHDAGSDQVHAAGIDQARRQQMEVVGLAVGDDGMAGIVAALGSRAQLGLGTENVDELSLAFVTPLGADHDGSHGCELSDKHIELVRGNAAGRAEGRGQASTHLYEDEKVSDRACQRLYDFTPRYVPHYANLPLVIVHRHTGTTRPEPTPEDWIWRLGARLGARLGPQPASMLEQSTPLPTPLLRIVKH